MTLSQKNFPKKAFLALSHKKQISRFSSNSFFYPCLENDSEVKAITGAFHDISTVSSHVLVQLELGFWHSGTAYNHGLSLFPPFYQQCSCRSNSACASCWRFLLNLLNYVLQSLRYSLKALVLVVFF